MLLLAHPGQRFDELHVDVYAMAGQWLLVALPAVGVALVALRGWQAVQLEAFEDAVDAEWPISMSW